MITSRKAEPIFVTGATGNVGQEVAKALHAQGYAVRAAALDSQDAANVPKEADEIVIFEFGKLETYAAAFNGVKKMFLMRPPAISDVEMYIKPAITYAAVAGIEQIAFLSLMGVGSKPYVPHYKIEQFLTASGVASTFLRASFFMQNLSTIHRPDIIERDEIFIPVGGAKTAFIDVRDIGAVAAHVLTTPGHENQAYDLTGQEALTYYEVAEIFTEVLDRKITYPNPSLLHFAWRMKQRGRPIMYVLVTTSLYLSTRLGSAATVTSEVQHLLGRKPGTMQQYIEDYAAVWR